tara:strand:- start:5110 stop:5541 length:432 start_codon:yes stop_codon:yes gene_type:complete
MKYNIKKKKLDTYRDSMVDTPKNREIQAELDYWNKLLPSYVKLFGFQEDEKTDKTIVVEAMAMKGCPKRYIGGNCNVKDWDKRNHPKGTISNFLGIGLNGEIEIGYKYLVEDVRRTMESYLNKPFINKDGTITTMQKIKERLK